VVKDKDWTRVVTYGPEFSGCNSAHGKAETKFCRDAGILE